MPAPAWRAKQSSSTSGTGTLTLNAASAAFRSFQAAFGTGSRKVLYTISGASFFEHGVGTYDGALPGTLTRDAVLASSNSNALVSLPAGTADVFAMFLPAQHEVIGFSSTASAALADLGSIFHYTGTGAATLNLPAIATVPPNAGFIVRNSAALTSGGVLTIDPNAAEQINGAGTLLLFPGESAQIFNLGGAWFAAGVAPGWRAVRQQVASNVAQIDFTLPAGFGRYRLECEQIRPVTDNTVLLMRTSTDGGGSFAAGGSDYARTVEATNPGGSNVSSLADAGSGMNLISDLDNSTGAHHASGWVDFTPGDGTRYPMAQSSFSYYGDTITAWRLQRGVYVRAAGTAVNALRLQMSSGNISIGIFTLSARA